MKDKLTPAKVFTTNGKATPDHDNMLLLFSRDSDRLKKICREVLRDHLKSFVIRNTKEQTVYVMGKEAFRDDLTFLSGYNNKRYTSGNLYLSEKIGYIQGDKEYYNDFKKRLKENEIQEVTNWEVKKSNIIFPEPEIEIQQWKSEEPIMSNNSYYIGSVDLRVEFVAHLRGDFPITDKWNRKEYVIEHIIRNIVFEFKPKIKSFSEVIRQINVYKHYLNAAKFYVITYSDIKQFKEVFEEQGIAIIQLNKDGGENFTQAPDNNTKSSTTECVTQEGL